jgi:hypothetical protein
VFDFTHKPTYKTYKIANCNKARTARSMDALDLRYIRERAKHEEDWRRELFGGRPKITKDAAKQMCDKWRLEVATLKLQRLQYEQLGQHDNAEVYAQAIFKRWFGIETCESMHPEVLPQIAVDFMKHLQAKLGPLRPR